VVRAALAEGLDPLSMSAVARRLGVSHSTLYRYVEDRNALLVAAVDLAVREWAWPPADLPWRELLEGFTESLWDFLEAHAGMAPAIWRIAGVPPAILELASTYTAALEAAGLSQRDSVLAYDFIADLAIAQSMAMKGLDETVETEQGPRSRREVHQASLSGILGDHPALTDPRTWTGRGWLDQKVELLLDGLAQRVPDGATTD